MSIKSSFEYLLKSITESKRLISALSKCSNKLVVATKTILSSIRSKFLSNDEVTLPISRKSFAFVLSSATASISSNRTITFSG